MGTIHQLILDCGVEQAKALTADKLDRQCVETAFAVMSDEEQRIGMMHAGFAMTALPHKATDANVWIRQGGPSSCVSRAAQTPTTQGSAFRMEP